MRTSLFLLMTVPLLWNTAVRASDQLPLDVAECTTILDHWVSDPKSVPKQVVEQCKQQLSAADAAPRRWPAPAAGPPAATDPCAGPNAGDSVYCWGPDWREPPRPAADAPPPPLVDVPDGPDTKRLAPEYEPEVLPPEEDVPELPLGSCAPGAPCGFATVVAGTTSTADAEDTRFASIALAGDGSQFSIDPGKPGQIDSVTGMTTNYLELPDGFENLEARGRSGNEQSALVARVVRASGDGELQVAADIWTHGNRATRTANSGYFAWGHTTTQAGLDALAGQGAIVSFSGPMSVDNRTMASMTLDFGTQAQWSGNWANPGYSFSAAGPISGVDLISDNTRFSANVLPGSVVQGALLGEPGNQSIAHIVEVNLSGTGLVRDVGLLSQSGP